MSIIDTVVQFILQVITQIGYPGIVGLMALESMGVPIPSEVVMPASGWLASDGALNLFVVTIAGTVGCTIGSAIAYWIGYWGGRAAVMRYGRYVFLNEKHLDAAERWFNKHGTAAIFFTRLMPVIRTYISFPAGMAKMRFWPFIIVSAIGSAIWCFILAYIGFVLGPRWDSINGAYNFLTIVLLAALGLVFVVWWYRRRRKMAVVEDAEHKVWRGAPSVWQRCFLCQMRDKCTKAGVHRGSKACQEARYMASSLSDPGKRSV